MKKYKFQRRQLAITVGYGILTLASEPTMAAKARLEEVIVTAQKHEENIQTVPLAISAITSEDMEKRHITSYEGVASASPSITFAPYPTSSNTLQIFMRGIGTIDPRPINSEGAIGLYEDGFYIARPQAATFDLADVERVEVLRGPQGTLYGRNTTGGAVNLISKQPTGQLDFKQQFDFGTRNLFRSLTAIDLPKWGDLSTKFTVLKSSTDGYVKNMGSSHDYGEERQSGFRFLSNWTPLDELAVDYFFEYGSLDSTPIYYENPLYAGMSFQGYTYPKADAPVSRTYRPIDLRLSNARFEGHGLTLTWDINSELTVKSLTGYRKLKSDDYQDYAEAFGYASTSDNVTSAHQFSQELQLVGDLADENINFVTGLYYFKEGGSGDASADYPDFFLSQTQIQTQNSRTEAVYGQINWTPPILDERLELTLGARYTRDYRESAATTYVNDAVVSMLGDDLTFSRFTPSFTANFLWTPDISIYGKVSTGYRAGGLYFGGGPQNNPFAPEKLTTYEAGLKSYWFDHKLRLNAAYFYSKYDDMQLPIPTDPSNIFIYTMYNIGEATVKGFELELEATPFEDLNLALNYSYLNSVFNKVGVAPNSVFDHQSNPASPYSVGDNIKGLFTMPFSPKNSFNLSSEYTFLHFDGGSASARLEYRWQDEIFMQPTAGPDVPNRDLDKVASRGLLDARLALAMDLPRGDHVVVSLWGKNIANKKYHQSIINSGGLAIPVESQQPDPANPGSTITTLLPAGYTDTAVAWSAPPSYGVSIAYQY